MVDTKIIRSKSYIKEVYEQLSVAVQTLKTTYNKSVKLAIVLVGNNPASEIYVRNKVAKAQEVGIEAQVERLPEDCSAEELLAKVVSLNKDPQVNGLILQLPLPLSLKNNEKEMMQLIDPNKDIDCFHAQNIGEVFLGSNRIVPCTSQGVLQLLEIAEVDPKGKDVVIVGASNIVGKPLALQLINREATVTVCQKSTVNLQEKTRKADILITCIGVPNFFTKDYIKEGVCIIDVGINSIENPKYSSTIATQLKTFSVEELVQREKQASETEKECRERILEQSKAKLVVGDVDATSVKGKAAILSAVPGGAGPLTIANLLCNTFSLALKQYGIDNKDLNLELFK